MDRTFPSMVPSARLKTVSRHRLSFCPCPCQPTHRTHTHSPHPTHHTGDGRVMNQHTKFDAEHAVLKNIRANYLTSSPSPALPPSMPPHTPCFRPVSPPPPLFAGVTGIVLRTHLVRGGRPVRALLPRARVGECRWGTAKTRFGANIRRASLSFCSEESPRAHRQRVPAVMVREAWTRAHEEGCGPSLHAPRPQPYGTVMRVGALRGP